MNQKQALKPKDSRRKPKNQAVPSKHNTLADLDKYFEGVTSEQTTNYVHHVIIVQFFFSNSRRLGFESYQRVGF